MHETKKPSIDKIQRLGINFPIPINVSDPKVKAQAREKCRANSASD